MLYARMNRCLTAYPPRDVTPEAWRLTWMERIILRRHRVWESPLRLRGDRGRRFQRRLERYRKYGIPLLPRASGECGVVVAVSSEVSWPIRVVDTSESLSAQDA